MAIPPTQLHADRLAARASRARRLQVLRGACRLILAALAALAAIVFLDAAFHLSLGVRCLLQLTWLALVFMLTWQFVLRPWSDDPSVNEFEGPPGVERSAHSPSMARLTAGTAVAALAALVLATSVPGAGEQLHRVAMPWHRSSAVLPFEIVITSGDSVIRRGGPITLTAYLKPRDTSAVMPETATLVIRGEPGSEESRLPMTGDATATFHATRSSVTEDFEYRIEAGSAASEWHSVRVADSVELTDRSGIEIVPPAYAGRPRAKIAGFSDFEGLQYSLAELRLCFNRPAESASLEWRPDGRPAIEPPDSIPLMLASDRLSGHATIRLQAGGELRAILINESGPRKLRTENVVSVRARVDAPPRFERMFGAATRLTARPGEQLAIEFAAEDDIGVAAAELEFSTSARESDAIRVPIVLEGAGTRRAEGRFTFDLAGKGKSGERVRYRLRVRDNRRVDERKLGPQEVLYPPSGWAEVQISEAAPPIDQQEIFGRRDAIRDRLNGVLREVAEVRTEAETLRGETAERSPLPVDHFLRASALRERIRKVIETLNETARDAMLAPDLRPLARLMRAAAEEPLAGADDALRKTATDDGAARAGFLAAAHAHLRDTGQRIEELSTRNDRVARDCLDRRRLARLAADQAALASRVKRTETQREELSKLQRGLLSRLLKLTAESDPLRRGAEAAASREYANLRAETEAITARVGELDAAAARLQSDVRRSLLDGLAVSQRSLVRRLQQLYPNLALSIRLTGVAAPMPEHFQHVADLIGADKIVEALTELERLAQALERAASEFDAWAADRTDPKLAAQLLAHWQADLRVRLLATQPAAFDKLPPAQKLDFFAEQSALLNSLQQFEFPASPELAAVGEAALIHLRMAVKRLAADGGGAAEAMKLAADTLARLAEKTPRLAERLSRTRSEVEKLRGEQDAILAAAEHILRPHDRQLPTPALIQLLIGKFAPVQLKQQKLAERLAALDLPGYQARRSKALRAARAAAADLNGGLPYDAVAALHGSRRELEQLLHVLDKQPAVDERADELAQKQAEVVRLLLDGGKRADGRQLEPIVALQFDIARQIDNLAAPEAASLARNARDAVKAAEASLVNGSSREKVVRLSREAVDALVLLSDRLGDREPERDRIRRLAENRRQGVCLAKELLGKARFELNLDVEELNATRVGSAGQIAKKVVLDLYARVQAEPGRQAADQKQLADALAALARKMEAAELTARPAPFPASPDFAKEYLPSRHRAELLRGLATDERELRDRASSLSAEVALRTHPASTNPLAPIAERQQALAAAVDGLAAKEARPAAEAARQAADRLALGEPRAARESARHAAQRLHQLPGDKAATLLAATQDAILSELAGALDDPAFAAAQQMAEHESLAKQALELARKLDLAARDREGGSASALIEAAVSVRQAERHLAKAAKKMAEGNADRATPLRGEARLSLEQAAEKCQLAGGTPHLDAPDEEALASGAAVRSAERAMQRALAELRPTGDAAAAEESMRRAAEALQRAAKAAETP